MVDSRLARGALAHGLLYLFLIVYGIVSLAPLLWLLATSISPSTINVYAWPPRLPIPPTAAHYREILGVFPVLRWLVNSLGVAAATVLLTLATCSLAGFGLARLRFPGRTAVFYAILGTMMMPFTVVLVPLFLTAGSLHLTNDYGGLVVPFGAGAFAIFLFRQAFLQIPAELEDAARIDGCSTLQMYLRVMLPLVRPTAAVVAIFTFYSSWNNFIWPLVTVNDDSLVTLPLGLAQLQGQLYGNWFQIAAGSVFMLVPVLVLFFAAQRHFIQGLSAGAVKG